jgi:hypothetical protein
MSLLLMFRPKTGAGPAPPTPQQPGSLYLGGIGR